MQGGRGERGWIQVGIAPVSCVDTELNLKGEEPRARRLRRAMVLRATGSPVFPQRKGRDGGAGRRRREGAGIGRDGSGESQEMSKLLEGPLEKNTRFKYNLIQCWRIKCSQR